MAQDTLTGYQQLARLTVSATPSVATVEQSRHQITKRQLPTTPAFSQGNFESWHSDSDDEEQLKDASSIAKSKGILVQEVDEGQPCLACGEKCPGFSLHVWRNTCNNCRCPREIHDVYHEEIVNVRDRLGWKQQDDSKHQATKEKALKQGYTWVPPGLPGNKIEEFMEQLPNHKIPKIGSPGEKYRDIQLIVQLPKQDLSNEYCKSLASEEEKKEFKEFRLFRDESVMDIGYVKENSVANSCYNCQGEIDVGEIAVLAPKVGLKACWHPACFVCDTCDELLVDLTYCQKDTKVFCERHYAELIKPRCPACDELVFSGEYTKAMEQNFHKEHLCCWKCDKKLVACRYIVKEEHPYCIPCYQELFAHNCEECKKPIGPDYKDLSYKDRHWHELCFKCSECQNSLVDQPFASKNDQIYCAECHDNKFAGRCDGCNGPFRGGSSERQLFKLAKALDVQKRKTTQYLGRREPARAADDSPNELHSARKKKTEDSGSLSRKKKETKEAKQAQFAKRAEVAHVEAKRIIDALNTQVSVHDSLHDPAPITKYLTPDENVPEGYDILGDWVAVPSIWLTETLSKCTQKPSPYCVKILMSGLFEPSEMGEMIGSTQLVQTPKGKALRRMKKFEYKGKQWHEECFCCMVCKEPICNKSFIPREGEVVCVPCYEEQYAQKCTKCEGVINKGGVAYKNTPWHRECFTCTNCELQLAGEKFTSVEEKPYCAKCYAELFAKKCCRCSDAITGFGGTKYISFEERHWHSDCFVCYKCEASMVGRGFLMNEGDIMCPQCGRS